MERMMKIVVPLRVVAIAATPGTVEVASLVVVVFENEMHVALAPRPRAHVGGKLGENVGRGVVGNGMHRVEPQPVEVVLLEPVERVVGEVVAHHASVRTVKERKSTRREP